MSSKFSFPSSGEYQDYYAMFQIPRDAGVSEIKKAYRRLALENHPDKNGGTPEATENFKTIQKGYETLGNPDQRTRYNVMYDKLRMQNEAAEARAKKEAAEALAKKAQAKAQQQAREKAEAQQKAEEDDKWAEEEYHEREASGRDPWADDTSTSTAAPKPFTMENILRQYHLRKQKEEAERLRKAKAEADRKKACPHKGEWQSRWLPPSSMVCGNCSVVCYQWSWTCNECSLETCIGCKYLLTDPGAKPW